MSLACVVALSMVVQLAAAVRALTLIRLTKKRLAWSLIALALLLMFVRRAISLYISIVGSTVAVMDPLQEQVGFVLSLFMLLGIVLIRPIFTERKQAEAELREMTDYLENLFSCANAPIIVWGPDLRITRFNRAFEELTGRSAEEVVGKKPDILFPEDRTEEALGYVTSASGGEHWEAVEIPILRTDGTVRTVLWNSATIYDEDGTTPIATIAQGQDITQRKQAEDGIIRLNAELEGRVRERTEELTAMNEELLEAIEQLDEATRAKSEFFTSMSHEFRTPLNSILGFTGIILDGLTGEINEEQRKQLGMVHDSGQHLLALVNDILDLSKIEVGDIKLKFSDFSMDEVVSVSIGPLRLAAEKAGLETKVEIADPDAMLHTNLRAVEQILINLVGNAVKFTESGSVGLDVSITAADRAIFRVWDTGPGIPKEDLEAIFDPFKQAGHLAAEGQPQGTGLGLAISSRLAARLGGSLTVESTLGEGSVFTLDIPMRLESTD